MSAKFTPGPEINRRWTVENDTGADLTVRAPNGFGVEVDANSYDPRERFAYFVIRQLQQDLAAAHAVLRELAESSQHLARRHDLQPGRSRPRHPEADGGGVLAMKERPILFSAPMVRALLAGTKTQTRRICKPQPISVGSSGKRRVYRDEDFKRVWETYKGSGECDAYRDCPYGKPGDRLWVRETWAYGTHALASKNHVQEGPWVYAADSLGTQGRLCDRWHPSIHMFRAASRLTLEITGVRVERLQDISKSDAMAEGISYSPDFEGFHTEDCRHFHGADPRKSYEKLWEHINGACSWDANPWVWVVEFKRT